MTFLAWHVMSSNGTLCFVGSFGPIGVLRSYGQVVIPVLDRPLCMAEVPLDVFVLITLGVVRFVMERFPL